MKNLTLILLLFLSVPLLAQQYTGMTGLIHVPSAEMDTVGDARIGAHFLHKRMLPKHPSFIVEGRQYNSFDAYMSLTPFRWVEIGLTITLEKGLIEGFLDDPNKFTMKDRYISIKFNPLREGKYYPAVALGMQDCASIWTFGHGIFSNYYITLTKHLDLWCQNFGFTLVYRHYPNKCNRRWNGVVGGITYSPSFARNWRAMVEWTGCAVNFGIDCLLWKHLMLQASLNDWRFPSAGICYVVNLF